MNPPMMNPMGQPPSTSLGFPTMRPPMRTPPIMAPGANPAAGPPAIGGASVPAAPAPATAATPAVPQNVPVSVVGAPAPTGAMPTGVMPTNPAAANGLQLPRIPGMTDLLSQYSGGGGGFGMDGDRAHMPGFARRIPGMTDLLSQYFGGGGDMHGLRQQMRDARQNYAGSGSIMHDANNGGTGLIDYLRAHLMPPATGGP